MSTDRYTDRLGDYVDGTLSDRDRQLLETHLAACESCRTEVEELTQIRQAARALPRLNPPEHLWKQIEVSLRAREPSRRPTSTWWSWSSGLAMAASVLLFIGSVGLLLWWAPFSTEPGPEDPVQIANYVVAELELAEQHYENAITGLEQILAKETESQTLDPEIMAVLNDNLALIEDAIGESRTAAREDPENIFARESLLGALRNKLGLLQNTIMIINEVRKGQGQAAYDLLNEMRDGQSSRNPI
jgi:hypothetical protein